MAYRKLRRPNNQRVSLTQWNLLDEGLEIVIQDEIETLRQDLEAIVTRVRGSL